MELMLLGARSHLFLLTDLLFCFIVLGTNTERRHQIVALQSIIHISPPRSVASSLYSVIASSSLFVFQLERMDGKYLSALWQYGLSKAAPTRQARIPEEQDRMDEDMVSRTVTL